MKIGYKAAVKYGYSNARVKAMEAKLLDTHTLQSILAAKDASSILSILFQTEYKRSITEFGGMGIKPDLVDFALSKDFAVSMSKLIRVTPHENQDMVRSLVGKWDLYNVKLVLEAKDRGMSYDSIARYVIDYGQYNASVIKEALKEDGMEKLISRLMVNSAYADILASTLEAYRKTKSIIETIESIDMGYYRQMGATIRQLQKIHPESARIIRSDIDRKNILTMLRAKRHGMKFTDISEKTAPNGMMGRKEMERIYNSSASVEALAEQIKEFDLKDSIDVYRKSNRLMSFEISMYNSILDSSIRSLSHSVLSFGTIIAFIYLKEIEVYTLRILIKSKAYGLSKEEVERLMPWKIA